jgi:hypothetical protein
MHFLCLCFDSRSQSVCWCCPSWCCCPAFALPAGTNTLEPVLVLCKKSRKHSWDRNSHGTLYSRHHLSTFEVQTGITQLTPTIDLMLGAMPHLPDPQSSHTPFRLSEKHFRSRLIPHTTPILPAGIIDLSRSSTQEEDEVWQAGWWGPPEDEGSVRYRRGRVKRGREGREVKMGLRG